MTTDDLSKTGPGTSPAQRIGENARSALYANKPELWALSDKGGLDFGYDLEAHVIAAADSDYEGVQVLLSIQLKGTTQPQARSADKRTISHSFCRRTLNLWHNSGIPIVVAIADLIDDQDPKTAKVFYRFINPDLDEILSALPREQKSVTLGVSVEQEIHRKLDILPVVRPYLDELQDLRRLQREKSKAAGTAGPSMPGTSVQQVGSDFAAASAAGDEIDALVDDLESPELKAGLGSYRSGDYERTLAVVPRPTEEHIAAAPASAAVAAYLRGRAFEAVGAVEKSEEMLALAWQLLPKNDDIAAAFGQRRLNTIDLGPHGRPAREGLLSLLDKHGGPSVACLKAKLYALEGDFERARGLLARLTENKSATTFVVVSVLERSWKRALSEVESGRSITTLTDRGRYWLDVLEARSHFELALEGVARPEDKPFVIPASGMAGIDYWQLQFAYDASLRAMLAAQRLGWPVDTQYLLDVFPASAMLLGHATDALPLLIALALARPKVTTIREVASKFAIQLDRADVVIELAELGRGSEPFEHEQAVMAVASYKSGNLARAFSYITPEFLSDSSSDDVYLTSLLMMGTAAQASLRNDVLEKIKARLNADEVSRHYGAILECAVKVGSSLLQRPAAIRGLYEYWKENGRPKVVGYNLLTNADPTDLDQAGMVVEIGYDLNPAESLDAEHTADLGQALLNLDRPVEAVEILEVACKRFRDEPRLQSLLGIALELTGQPAKAFELIERLLASGEATESARRYFVQIALRMGYLERAEEQVRAAYAKAQKRERRLQHLNTLFQVLLAMGNRATDVESIAWEYGKVANKDDEREEGLFLQQYIVATLPKEPPVPPERLAEFRDRIQAYTERFPESRYFWQAKIPTEGPPEALQAALQQAAGITAEEVAGREAVERRMDAGLLQVPFSWRPRRFLRNIPDAFMLWEVRKAAPLERAGLHFSCSVDGFDRGTPRADLKQFEVVVSLTSLMVLDEIGLLDVVLDQFDRIVVARSTLIALQAAKNPLSSGWGYARADRIIGALQRRFAKVSHPPYLPESKQKGLPEWYHEDKAAMADGKRLYLADDIVEAAVVCGVGDATKPSMSTVDFLNWADKEEVLDPYQIADALGQLARLKIGGLRVEQRYLVAAIPDSLQEASDAKAAGAAMEHAESLRSILDGIWDSSIPFETLLSHFAQTLAYLISKGNAREEVLVAFWLRWLAAVRFQVRPKETAMGKLAIAFVSSLSLLPVDGEAVTRLWRALWTTVNRGLGKELREPEDIASAKSVAAVLGRGTADPEAAETAGAMFRKARSGLQQDTDVDTAFHAAYIDAAAKYAMEQRKPKAGT